MNNSIASFARKQILDGLRQLPEGSQRVFKLMYGRNNGKRPVADSEAMTIEAVVQEMPDDKLDWALSQVEQTLKKASK